MYAEAWASVRALESSLEELRARAAGRERELDLVEFELREVQMVGASLTGTAMVKNLQNKRFPRITKNYSYQQFPSLLP